MTDAHMPSVLVGAVIAALITAGCMAWALNPTRVQRQRVKQKALALEEARLDRLVRQVRSWQAEPSCQRRHVEDVRDR